MNIQDNRVAFSVNESAESCGLSAKTVWQKIHSGELRAARVGSRVLVLRSDLEAWLSSLANNSGALTRPDLSEGVTARNKARARVR
ncbi:MAG: hypothetical protein CVV27_17135, partial [Candidatus Melainabacteria bacterium HGW-Melainabacteria-1]